MADTLTQLLQALQANAASSGGSTAGSSTQTAIMDANARQDALLAAPQRQSQWDVNNYAPNNAWAAVQKALLGYYGPRFDPQTAQSWLDPLTNASRVEAGLVTGNSAFEMGRGGVQGPLLSEVLTSHGMPDWLAGLAEMAVPVADFGVAPALLGSQARTLSGQFARATRDLPAHIATMQQGVRMGGLAVNTLAEAQRLTPETRNMLDAFSYSIGVSPDTILRSLLHYGPEGAGARMSLYQEILKQRAAAFSGPNAAAAQRWAQQRGISPTGIDAAMQRIYEELRPGALGRWAQRPIAESSMATPRGSLTFSAEQKQTIFEEYARRLGQNASIPQKP